MLENLKELLQKLKTTNIDKKYICSLESAIYIIEQIRKGEINE